HCKMVAIPTIKDEDGKRPNRERESLIGEQTRIVNRMKATLIRLGIRGFNPKLKKAAGRLEDLRTPEDEPERKGPSVLGQQRGHYPCTGASRLKRSFCSSLSEP